MTSPRPPWYLALDRAQARGARGHVNIYSSPEVRTAPIVADRNTTQKATQP